MSRTVRTTLLLALLAALASPAGLAQHGPPPGYTDPVVYAQDYAADQAGQAQADPVAYAQGKDAAAEAEHAAWLACWAAYDAGEPLSPVCAPFFTAPVQEDAIGQSAEAQVTQVLNDTGAQALADETLDVVNDTLADPTDAVAQVQRAVRAVAAFARDAVAFVLDLVRDVVREVLDILGLAGLALAAGALGAAQGLLDLVLLPLEGLELAAGGLGALGAALLDGAQAATDSVQSAVASVLGAVGAAAAALADGMRDGAHGARDGVAAAARALADGVADAASATVDAVQDGVSGLASEIGGWFGGGKDAPAAPAGDGLPQAGEATDEAGNLVERLLDRL